MGRTLRDKMEAIRARRGEHKRHTHDGKRGTIGDRWNALKVNSGVKRPSTAKAMPKKNRRRR